MSGAALRSSDLAEQECGRQAELGEDLLYDRGADDSWPSAGDLRAVVVPCSQRAPLQAVAAVQGAHGLPGSTVDAYSQRHRLGSAIATRAVVAPTSPRMRL
jgi:hypothetical protein